MEKTVRSQRIPDTDSIEELSRFWDTHDLTDIEDQLEEVRTPVFGRGEAATFAIALKPREVQALKRMARSEGVQEAMLVREWVREKLRGASANKPPNKALQPSARKTRRG